MQSKKSLCLITGNKNKLLEFKMILGDSYDLEIGDADLPELQGTPEEIAKEKAQIAFKSVKKPVIVEDTSLCFNAYKGLPGPYIKWFLARMGPSGLKKMLAGFEDQSGYAQCIISYMDAQIKEPILFIGQTPGTIVEPRQKEGEPAFGWDPIFLPEGFDKTYAQLDKQTKNTISHRFKAIEAMQKHFN